MLNYNNINVLHSKCVNYGRAAFMPAPRHRLQYSNTIDAVHDSNRTNLPSLTFQASNNIGSVIIDIFYA